MVATIVAFSTEPPPVSQTASHSERRRKILAAHPEVRDLFGRDSTTFVIAVGTLVAQTATAALMGHLGAPYWPLALFLAIAFGAFANHANFVIIHDAVHNLVFKSRALNRITAIIADLPNGIPTAMSFRCYHMKHHAHLSAYDHDADVPSQWEVRLVGHGGLRKALWLFCFPIVQLTRIPRLQGPLPLWTGWMLANVAAVALYDLAMVAAFGPFALVYLLMSFWFSIGGLHPLTARWLQEHFAFETAPTSSYYGWLNRVALNIGYHNEHHDFPEIPWSRLPRLTAMVADYTAIPAHASWTRLLVRFVTDPRCSLELRASVREAETA